MMNVWIVYKQFETGKIERVAAFLSEESARKRAADLVGKDRALIGLETIPVEEQFDCRDVEHLWSAAVRSPRGGYERGCNRCHVSQIIDEPVK